MDVSLSRQCFSPSLSLFLLFSLKLMGMFSGEDLKKKKKKNPSLPLSLKINKIFKIKKKARTYNQDYSTQQNYHLESREKEHRKQEKAEGFYHHQISVIRNVSPGWCGSLDWTLACKPKGCRFDSQLGNMPGLWAGSTWEATTHGCFSPSLLSPFPCLKIKIYFSKKKKCLRRKKIKIRIINWQ